MKFSERLFFSHYECSCNDRSAFSFTHRLGRCERLAKSKKVLHRIGDKIVNNVSELKHFTILKDNIQSTLTGNRS